MTSISRIARVAAPLGFVVLLGLSACSNEPSPPPLENSVENQVLEETPPEAIPPASETLNVAPVVNTADAAAVDRTSEDQQMQEDADASGMTSRLPPPNQSVASSEGEKKQ
ncbi:hypothetical protein [Sphingomonas sp.]|uniref:hypothetical protein n=1 Tax=Sphingomonas sp. TaxID=28214 RepID=UPI0025F6E6F0|nr:hypothetical protein [Sphingomonas sp.]